VSPLGPISKRILRAPVGLYEIGAGRLLGHRFLLLTHRGRRSGRIYRTTLEVLFWEPAKREAIVMSGFGPRADWYLNSLSGGALEVQIAGLRLHPEVRTLRIEEAVRVLADYERRSRLVSPIVRLVLSRLAGFEYDGSEGARRRLASALPLIAFAASP
jgi:deazaflavin-dependent oxidoreductase (nitroreductase family)